MWRSSLRAAAGALAGGALFRDAPSTCDNPRSFARRRWSAPATIEEVFAKFEPESNADARLNRPTAGARSPGALPRGPAPFQLYSLATPNGQKVAILLEELGVEYDARAPLPDSLIS